MLRTIVLLLFLTSTINAMPDSLDMKIGQMIMVGMKGTTVTPNSKILQHIRNNIIGGILLFEFNLNSISTLQNLESLTSKLKAEAKIPLLIAIDQEGGKVNRLKQKYGFDEMPSAKSLGDQNDMQSLSKTAQIISTALYKAGINVNFAPVLDVHNSLCPVLGKLGRCYSSDVEVIAQMASVLLDSMSQKNIIGVGKHFPGHGNSRTDSHKSLVDVSNYWDSSELKPYQKLIKNNKLQAVMTGHIINSKLDKTNKPATLSEEVVTTLLRKKLGFNGVVFSDDMQMHAISSHYGFEQSIKLAIQAGVDILIFSNNIENATQYTPENIHQTIKKLVLKGDISKSQIDESYQRIQTLKRQL
ncbi:MAG TPA: beta-N-acetylhexosaminidase [Chitinophagaceae bacterium]|nr:beta-N-acetylhexosaminidase [Chitinophagaceae bacterium]